MCGKPLSDSLSNYNDFSGEDSNCSCSSTLKKQILFLQMHCIALKFPISFAASWENFTFYYALTPERVLSVPSSISTSHWDLPSISKIVSLKAFSFKFFFPFFCSVLKIILLGQIPIFNHI